MTLLAKLEAEAAVGWPEPWWPQDRPEVRRQRFPERCSHGHDLAEQALWRRVQWPCGVSWVCRACARLHNNGVLWRGCRPSPAQRLEILEAA